MTRINHIAIKVDDLQAATDLYENVFGLKYVSTVQSVGHISRHLSDGTMYLTLLIYENEEAPEATIAGAGPCIHHFGLEVEDPAKYEAMLKSFPGIEIISGTATKLPVKFRTKDGIVGELLEADTIDKAGKK
jgi:catechol 2,3-dioxygenase-like lactoylglutathione lyase family enzyme